MKSLGPHDLRRCRACKGTGKDRHYHFRYTVRGSRDDRYCLFCNGVGWIHVSLKGKKA